MIISKYDEMYETEYVQYDFAKYCAYCGKKIEPTEIWDHYDCEKYYHCNCEDAKLEREYQIQSEKIKKEMYSKLSQLQKPNVNFKSGEIIEYYGSCIKKSDKPLKKLLSNYE